MVKYLGISIILSTGTVRNGHKSPFLLGEDLRHLTSRSKEEKGEGFREGSLLQSRDLASPSQKMLQIPRLHPLFQLCFARGLIYVKRHY